MSEELVLPNDNKLVGLDGQPISGGLAKVPTFSEEDDCRQDIMRRLGDLDDIELFFNDVLVAKYIREMASENIIASAVTQLEDNWQGVVGLVLKVGPRAYVDDGTNKFYGLSVRPGDWVLYRNSDGWDKDIQCVGEYTAVRCRIIQDAHIRGRVKYPGRLQ
jgi:hypothetical protein